MQVSKFVSKIIHFMIQYDALMMTQMMVSKRFLLYITKTAKTFNHLTKLIGYSYFLFWMFLLPLLNNLCLHIL